jgi:hypothetical protein
MSEKAWWVVLAVAMLIAPQALASDQVEWSLPLTLDLGGNAAWSSAADTTGAGVAMLGAEAELRLTYGHLFLALPWLDVQSPLGVAVAPNAPLAYYFQVPLTPGLKVGGNWSPWSVYGRFTGELLWLGSAPECAACGPALQRFPVSLTVGAGLEYLISILGVALEARYSWTPGSLADSSPGGTGNLTLQSLTVFVALRFYFIAF